MSNQHVLRRLLSWPIQLLNRALTAALSPRGCAVLTVLLLGSAGTFAWLRPPISADITGFQISLLPTPMPDGGAHRFLHESRDLVLTSPGVLIFVLAVLAMVAICFRRRGFALGAGLLLAGIIAGRFAVTCNHPELAAELDYQVQVRQALVGMIQEVATPEISVTAYPRISRGSTGGPGALTAAATFIPKSLDVLILIAGVALLFAGSRSLPRRVLRLGVWSAIGLAAGAGLCHQRLLAEYHWSRATQFELVGRLDDALAQVTAATDAFPALDHVPRTWELIGKIDYQRGRTSPAARYFVASQSARSGDSRRAVDEFESLADSRLPDPAASRWLSRTIARSAYDDFRFGRLDAAEQGLQRAVALHSANGYDELGIAVLRASTQRGDAGTIAPLIEPVLPGIADRALRASLLAMLGDAYFEIGDFNEARRCYAQSLRAFGLPKKINYRALRGLVGM